MAAICVVALLRPPRQRPVPARIASGDAVMSEEGVCGRVVRVSGPFALIDAGNKRSAWVKCSELALTDSVEEGGSLPGVTSGYVQADTPPPDLVHDAGGLLARLGDGVFTARRTIAWGWLTLVVVSIPLAATAEQAFTQGGFLVKNGEATKVIEEIRDDFQMPVGQQVMIVPGSVDEVKPRVERILPELYRVPHVMGVSDPRPSKDGSKSAVTIWFDDTDDRTVDSFKAIEEVWHSAGYKGADLQVAGTPAVFVDTSRQMKRDLTKAEMIGAPLALAVLLLVFGTGVAAIVPLIIGMASVVITLSLLHILSLSLDLSIFVMNIASMLGLGLGIDYSLLGVSRFREELASGKSVRSATITMVATSGRAAAISGVAVITGVAALAVIPLPVMFALAIGGVVVVCVSVIASLTLLPALLALLGPRVERLRVRRFTINTDLADSRWYRIAHVVMRRPGISIFGGAAILMLLALPALGAVLDVPHDDVLSADAPSAVARATLKEDFGERIESPVILIVDSADQAVVDKVATLALGVKHLQRSEVIKVDKDSGRTLLNIHGDAALANGGPVSRETTRQVKELDFPVNVRVSGQGAGEIEFLTTVSQNMPHTLVLMFASTFIILTVAFRSLTLPVKAIVLDTLSILASLGCVVAVFQDGFGINVLGTDAIGYTEATTPIILFCLLFGLSMDYEVFMLARVTELYQSGLNDREATAQGVASTAPLVTGAALILIVIGISFATTQHVLVKQIGFGMAVALALDATVVRVLLLPATMRWLGPANWWLPKFLQRRIPRMEWAH